MTSAAFKSARSGGRHTEAQGLGLIVFASVLLAMVGFFNLIYGIAAIANSHVFVANAHYVFGSLRTWGWITLIIGALQVLARAGCWLATSWPAGSRWPSWGSAPSTRCSSSPPTRSGR